MKIRSIILSAAALLIGAAAFAHQRVIQPFSALANPTDPAGRHSGHQRKIGNILRHHRTGGNQCAATDRMAAYNSAVGTQRSPFTYQSTGIDPMHRKMRPRRDHIGEHTARPAEDVILQFNPLIQGNIVLDSHSIAHTHIVPDIHILPQ